MGRRAKTDTTTAATLSAEELSTLAALLGKLIGAGAAPAGDADTDAGGDGLDLGGDADGGGDDLFADGGDDTPEGPSKEDVIAAVKELTAKCSREIAGKALAKFGAAKVPELDEDKYAEFIDFAKKVLVKHGKKK